MIDIKRLTKQFGDHKVLDDVSGTITENSVVAVLGPSGSGKSTFLRCLNLLEKPTSGQIIIDGIDIADTGFKAGQICQRIGIVFQQFNLFPHMTILENIAYAPQQVLKLPASVAKKQAGLLLERIGLQSRQKAYPGQLSGGQKQRVAIARALAMQPQIMLFDEPTSALDPEMVQEVLDVIKGLVNDNMTIILVTHEVHFARQIADSIWFFDHGKLLEQTPPQQFFAKPQTPRAQQFLSKVI